MSIPSASQPMPAAATSACSTVTVTHAMPVPAAPKTANSGSSRRPTRSTPGPR